MTATVQSTALHAIRDLDEILAYLDREPQWHKKGHSRHGQTVTLLAGDLASDTRTRRNAAAAARRLRKRWLALATLTESRRRNAEATSATRGTES
jgi:hypothetical protein